MQQDDRALVARLLAGDDDAFRSFFDEYFDRLYRFALSRTSGRTDLAEEAAQRTLCRALRALQQYRGEASLFTWLAQICRNELADLGESERRDAERQQSYDASERARQLAEGVASADAAPAERAQAAVASDILRRALDALPGRYGDILEWKYLEDWSVQQIAAELGASFESAQSSLARARLALRSALVASGIDWHELLP
ncbi:MAG TPA: RNA polymerase sigma factor [Steroidobacteraceae bacterium]|nr:RNA polymerase sigma factor [Steroidobacteraceae bacterium]HNS27212.1 RNA polymerase sigma factor [Steroidobacteraceae bacterium]